MSSPSKGWHVSHQCILVTLVIVPVLVPAFVLVQSVLAAAAVVVAVLANAPVLVLVDGVVGLVVRDVVACAARVSIVIVFTRFQTQFKAVSTAILGHGHLVLQAKTERHAKNTDVDFQTPICQPKLPRAGKAWQRVNIDHFVLHGF